MERKRFPVVNSPQYRPSTIKILMNSNSADNDSFASSSPDRLQQSTLEQNEGEISALGFVLPLVLILVSAMFAPSFETETDSYTLQRNNAKAFYYTLFIIGQVLVVSGVVAYFFHVYRSQFPLRVSRLSVLVGVVGCVLWVAIAKLGIEHEILKAFGLEAWLPKRVGFNPFQIESTGQRYLFLTFRFALLAGLIPVIEELFLRGWLIRYVDNEDFWLPTLSGLTFRACVAATLYGVLTHPGEIFAAIVWFSLVTWMMKRTGLFWDCVVAHAVTNLLLGIWVLYSSDWFLW